MTPILRVSAFALASVCFSERVILSEFINERITHQPTKNIFTRLYIGLETENSVQEMSDNESVSNESISNESLVSETESQDDSRSASPTESLASVEVAPVTVESLIGELVPAVSEEMATAGIALSPSTVMQVLRIAMEAVEGSPIKGEEQKELAVKIILELAENADLPDEHKFLIKSIAEGGLINDTIDLVIEATKGELDINKATKVAKGCFARWMRVFKREKTEEEKQKKKEFKEARDLQKKKEYKEMCKKILEREEKRKQQRRQLEKDLAAKEKERQEKAAEKKEAKKAKKEAEKAKKEEEKKKKEEEKEKAKKEAERKKKQEEKEKRRAEKKKRASSKRRSLNVSSDDDAAGSKAGSVQVPSELSFPALSSSLPDSVVRNDDGDKDAESKKDVLPKKKSEAKKEQPKKKGDAKKADAKKADAKKADAKKEQPKKK